ncbi:MULTISPECIES: LPS export ABC transporter periplasmic protein LptC [unclassified Novosphingobium]|uniref:LPS export ABC transporter periplasmic protein LptC n=1 Tax=Novosphingobium TaxID=165696 RepID=UPI001445DE13|nr:MULTISPECIES: LPS export ABC transporter periplasmic protein LptC [unclassified Novosphingobium]NKJ43246.1 lipopolysaccharide export system protein LptC [Novosphingobium sp. SG720]NMN07060.1 lipopolysaccharide export system protein LptC [Novosphingobium sp. SG919]NMN89352.1 lipopolysaccharide export system protein LptC [Novosphingobium sp. SG916]
MTVQADRMRNRRQHKAAPGGRHDRVVRTLAVVLPGLIGAMLAVMVLSPLAPRGEISFLLDRTKVAVVADRLRVVSAMYRGADNKGRTFSVTAGTAVQHSAAQDVVQLKDVTARVMLKDGPAILTTQQGAYDFGKQFITVPGVVNFESSDGYRMITDGASIDLNKRRMVSDGHVEGRLPTGTFSADRITANLDDRVVTLEGHARMRMDQGKLPLPAKP